MNAPHPLYQLTGPARGRLLEALKSAPDDGVHVRELSRGAALSLSSVSRELARLSALGAVKRRRKGNRVVYSLKRQSPFVRSFLAALAALDLQGNGLDGSPADRKSESALVSLCAHFPPDADLWREAGDPGYLSGVAVMLAGHSGFDRAAYLTLAESLCPGSSTVESFESWYRKHHPDFPRLFSFIDRERRTHARVTDQ